MNIVCHIFGHRWKTTENIRVCKRCKNTERYSKIEFTKLGACMFRKINLSETNNLKIDFKG